MLPQDRGGLGSSPATEQDTRVVVEKMADDVAECKRLAESLVSPDAVHRLYQHANE